MYAIYKHLNKINGKIYIGQTKYYNNPELRWKDGKHYNNKLKSDLNKYDWNTDFMHTILLVVETKEEADLYEKYYIMFHQSIEYGYNILIGGECVPQFIKKLHNEVKSTPKYFSIVSLNTNKQVFKGSKKDVLSYIKNYIYPCITPTMLGKIFFNKESINSEFRCGESFILKRSNRPKHLTLPNK